MTLSKMRAAGALREPRDPQEPTAESLDPALRHCLDALQDKQCSPAEVLERREVAPLATLDDLFAPLPQNAELSRTGAVFFYSGEWVPSAAVDATVMTPATQFHFGGAIAVAAAQQSAGDPPSVEPR